MIKTILKQSFDWQILSFFCMHSNINIFILKDCWRSILYCRSRKMFQSEDDHGGRWLWPMISNLCLSLRAPCQLHHAPQHVPLHHHSPWQHQLLEISNCYNWSQRFINLTLFSLLSKLSQIFFKTRFTESFYKSSE